MTPINNAKSKTSFQLNKVDLSKIVPVRNSTRMNGSIQEHRAHVAKIEEGEAFVLTYKNSIIRSSNSFSRMSGINSASSPKTRENSPSFHLLSRIKYGKSYKNYEREYFFIKDFINDKIDNTKTISENHDLKFKEKFEEIMV